MAFKFEKLKVWQKTLELNDEVNIVAKSFPKDELFMLASQFKSSRFSQIKNGNSFSN